MTIDNCWILLRTDSSQALGIMLRTHETKTSICCQNRTFFKESRFKKVSRYFLCYTGRNHSQHNFSIIIKKHWCYLEITSDLDCHRNYDRLGDIQNNNTTNVYYCYHVCETSKYTCSCWYHISGRIDKAGTCSCVTNAIFKGNVIEF